MTKSYLIVFLSLIFLACERNIDLNLPEEKPALVVEGEVSNENKAWEIKLSVSASYYSQNYLPVADAKVTISHGAQIDTLFHSAEGIYKSKESKMGKVGETYFLTIHWQGNTYTAAEQLNNQLPLDTVSAFYLPKNNGIVNEGWYAFIGADEIQGIRNRDYYEWKVFINDTLYDGNGILIDTDEFREVGYWNLLIDPNDPLAQQDQGILPRPIADGFDEGDTIRIEQYAISRNYYDFLLGLFNVKNAGGPFSSPASNPPTNLISNQTVYGYFKVVHKEVGTIIAGE